MTYRPHVSGSVRIFVHSETPDLEQPETLLPPLTHEAHSTCPHFVPLPPQDSTLPSSNPSMTILFATPESPLSFVPHRVPSVHCRGEDGILRSVFPRPQTSFLCGPRSLRTHETHHLRTQSSEVPSSARTCPPPISTRTLSRLLTDQYMYKTVFCYFCVHTYVRPNFRGVPARGDRNDGTTRRFRTYAAKTRAR